MNKRALFESLETRTLLAGVKILPLGDSITEALSGHDSYRYQLWTQLKQAGYQFEFVGSRHGNNAGNPPNPELDQDHMAFSGWRADEFISRLGTNFAGPYDPDIVLLHLGTNDLIHGESVSSTIADISGIIDDLRRANSNVTILLAQIIPNMLTHGITEQFNSEIATLASQKNTGNSRVIAVDQYSTFNADIHTYDGIHANAVGEEKMASRWFSALQGVLPSPSGNNTYQKPSISYLANMTPVKALNGLGPVELNRNNGGSGAGDGRTMLLNGIKYRRGLGVYSASDVRYNFNGAYDWFQADIGVDDIVGGRGSLGFRVFADGVKIYDSGFMNGASATQHVKVNVNGAQQLRLLVIDWNNGNKYDYANWCDARVVANADDAIGLPYAATALSNFNWNSSSYNGWGSAEKNRANGNNTTGDAGAISIDGHAYVYGLGVYANSRLDFNINKAWSVFEADLGIDDETQGAGSVVYQVFADGVKIYDSGTVNSATPVKSISLNIGNVTTLSLVVTDGGDGNGLDHANWANARLR